MEKPQNDSVTVKKILEEQPKSVCDLWGMTYMMFNSILRPIKGEYGDLRNTEKGYYLSYQYIPILFYFTSYPITFQPDCKDLGNIKFTLKG